MFVKLVLVKHVADLSGNLTHPVGSLLNGLIVDFAIRMTSLVAQMVKHLFTMWETPVQSLVMKISWRRYFT